MTSGQTSWVAILVVIISLWQKTTTMYISLEFIPVLEPVGLLLWDEY